MASPSISDEDDASSVTVSGASPDCGLAAKAALGASFTEATLIATVATFDGFAPSSALKVKLSLPLKFAAGVYVRLGAVPLNVPWLGPLWIEYVTGESPSSAEVNVIVVAESSLVDTV